MMRTTGVKTPLSQRVVERAALRMNRAPKADRPGPGPRSGSGTRPGSGSGSGSDRPGSTRRSFLSRSAVVGSALAVAPARFLLRPGTAYAAVTDVCGPDATCRPGGFTVFCCTINNGVNKCPGGSIPGGWWRAGTGSSWCCGGDRYYIDCQAACPPGCACDSGNFCPGCQACTGGCYQGSSCDQRNVCQVRFRYGQCNQHVSCTGNVLCRMVSCTPPWQIAGLNCASGPDKSDARTAEHSAPCLQQASWSGGAFPISSRFIQASPAVVQAHGSSRLEVFAKGTDQRIHRATNLGGGFSGWQNLGAPRSGSNGGPAAVGEGPGTLSVFVRGGDNRLWQRRSTDNGTTWSGWLKPLGDDIRLASAPAVCSWAPGRIDLFVIATDGLMYHRWFEHGWNSGGWEGLGAPPAPFQFSALAATSWAPGHIDVFATAGDSLWQSTLDGAWHPWVRPASSGALTLTSAPAATSWGRDHLAVFAKGADSTLHWTTFFQSFWSDWQRIGNPTDTIAGNPSASSGGCQNLSAFGRGQSGHIRQYRYSG
jgi:hypothetical protein